MTYFFVLFGLVVVLLVISCIIIGYRRGVKSAAKDLIDDSGKRESYLKIAIGEAAGLALVLYLFLFFASMWILGFSELRNDYFRRYENGKYVKEYRQTTYKAKDGTTYIYKQEPTWRKQKEMQKEVEEVKNEE